MFCRLTNFLLREEAAFILAGPWRRLAAAWCWSAKLRALAHDRFIAVARNAYCELKMPAGVPASEFLCRA
jgi:hypothetical protein